VKWYVEVTVTETHSLDVEAESAEEAKRLVETRWYEYEDDFVTKHRDSLIVQHVGPGSDDEFEDELEDEEDLCGEDVQQINDAIQ
jgi:hypothetical protein